MNQTIEDNPQWVRMPAPGEKLEGLGRHSLYRAVDAGTVRFRSVKIRPDAKRGIPYVSLADIRKLIENSPIEPESAPAAA